MTNPSDREVAVFNAALQLPAGRRAPFLDQECAGDSALRARVEALLRIHDEVGTFLENPTQAVGSSSAAGEALGPNGTIRLDIPSLEKSGDRIGRYKLLQQIGEGGCGVVYMAEQSEPVRRKVALKVIKLGMDTKNVIARFEAERQALALMDHPNIAKVFDAGATETGRPFFVMELVRGIKITEYCDQQQLPTEARLKIFAQVCQAIQHAHQKGIIHRDIKPSNILVADHDGVPVPKIIDFGIAKATTDQPLTDKTLFTALEQFIGTPAYMSPEQANLSGLDIDTRTDVYSLGVLLYELLTGKTPFDATSLLAAGLEEMRRTIREQEPERPSTALSTMQAADLTTVAKHRQSDAPKLVHLVRGDLDWIVMKALEKDRTRRYETANGLAMDVQRYLANEPVVARPPSSLYRFQKMARRNKVAFVATSAVAVALVLGLAASTWLFFKEKEARQRAVGAEREQIRLRESAELAGFNEARLRQQAEADEKKAKTEAGKSQQVARFLQEMLKSVGPSVALGRDTTMLREILDRTAGSVGRDLKAQPEVEAELRNAIGEVYFELGDYDQAEAMHREALAKREKLFGPANRDTAASLHYLARVLYRRNKLSEAEPLARRALAVRQKLLGDEDRDVAASLNILANILSSQGQTSEAEAIYRQTLAMQKKLQNEEGVATALNNLALILRKRGSNGEAEAMFRESLAMYQKALGREHPTMAMSLNNLAETLRSERKLAEAETADREALAIRKKLFGSEHPFASQSLDVVLWVLEDQGKLAEAETMAREALAGARRSATNDSVRFEDRLAAMANVLRWQKKQPEAEALLLEALTSARQFATNDPSRLEDRLSDAANNLRDQRKYPEAESLDREALASARRTATNEPVRLEERLAGLAIVLQQEQKHPESEALFRESLASARRFATNDPARLEACLGGVGASLRDQQEYPEAEALFREALTIARQSSTNDPGRLELRAADVADILRHQRKFAEAETLYREALVSARLSATNDSARIQARTFDLAGVLEEQGRQPEAEAFYQDALVFHRKLFGSENSGLASLFHGMADLLVRDGKLMDAEAAYREAAAMRKKLSGTDNIDLAGSLHNLGDVLAREDKPAEAEASYREALAIRRKLPENNGWDVAGSLYNLSDVLVKEGKPDEAQVLRSEAQGISKNLWIKDPVAWENDISDRADALVREGKFEEAEQLFNEVLTSAVEGKTESIRLRRARGIFFGSRGKWKEAALDLSRAIAKDPANRDQDHRLALLWVATGDLDAYRQQCQRMLAHFGGTNDPVAAGRMAKACLIIPSSGTDPGIVAKWVETALALGTNPAALPWNRWLKGLAEYRLGHFTEAADWMPKVLAVEGEPERDAEAYLVLAMARQNLNQSAGARAALVTAIETVNTKLPRLDSGNIGHKWFDWLVVQTLLREANGLVIVAPTGASILGNRK